jgi:uncharacterized repeat protein (TIGR03803 family)
MRAGSVLMGIGLIGVLAAAAPSVAAPPIALTTLYRFSGQGNGQWPLAPLISDSSGALYGTTSGGRRGCPPDCGTVFKLTPPTRHRGAWTETELDKFAARRGADGTIPMVGLIMDPAGALYGTTIAGGALGYGTVFKLTPIAGGTYAESVLHSFAGIYSIVAAATDTPRPSRLIIDAKGALYGTTTYGGSSTNSNNCGFGCGTVFKLTPAAGGTYTERAIYDFRGATTDGAYPSRDGLIMDSVGALYGATSRGGSFNEGTIFKLTPAAGGAYAERVLFSFKEGRDGAFPAGLIRDAAGALYGTTHYGGALGYGAVFKLTPVAGGTYTESALHSFAGGADGAFPQGGVVMDAKGELYGTTTYGGGSCSLLGKLGCGTLFSLVPKAGGGYEEKLLYQFTGKADGAEPSSALFSSVKGIFLSTTLDGGSGSCPGLPGGCGTVFEFVAK